jgi:hypothetical protein
MRWIRWGLLPGALFATSLQPQETKPPQETSRRPLLVTTQERLETETWWPTADSAPLKAYAGSVSCKGCHANQFSSPATGMQRAATPGPGAHLLAGRTSASFVSGAFTYSLMEDKASVQLAVFSGSRKAAQTVDWVIGAGDLGRTFLYQAGGRWFQSEASFYTKPSLLDITTGFGPSAAASPAGALGNALSPAEARACFGCHTVHATTSAGMNPLHAEAGVGCEGCHGPGQQHVEQMSAKEAPAGSAKLQDLAIFQPAKLSPADSIDFCGACHRSFADASLSTGPQADRAVVRFQPYRLEESKCWRTTQDQRLTCVACHDPHKPLNRDPASYDGNCLQCHSSVQPAQHVAAVCPKATQNCVTCHMPKVSLPSMHGEFTDHYIRIASGESQHK